MGISISETPHSTLAVNFIFSSMNFNAFGRLIGGGDISISERLSYRNHYMCSGEATSNYEFCYHPTSILIFHHVTKAWVKRFWK